MDVKRGEIIRYVLVKFDFGYPSWYYDELDEVNEGDMALASHGTEELVGQVVKVVRCVYPHVLFDIYKTKPIIKIIKNNTGHRK